MHRVSVDYTSLFRALASVTAGKTDVLGSLVDDADAFEPWIDRWKARLAAEGRAPSVVVSSMNSVNPVYIPRNHLVEEALEAGSAGDLGQFEQLLAAIKDPFEVRPGFERFADPAPGSFSRYYQTFCGT